MYGLAKLAFDLTPEQEEQWNRIKNETGFANAVQNFIQARQGYIDLLHQQDQDLTERDRQVEALEHQKQQTKKQFLGVGGGVGALAGAALSPRRGFGAVGGGLLGAGVGGLASVPPQNKLREQQSQIIQQPLLDIQPSLKAYMNAGRQYDQTLVNARNQLRALYEPSAKLEKQANSLKGLFDRLWEEKLEEQGLKKEVDDDLEKKVNTATSLGSAGLGGLAGLYAGGELARQLVKRNTNPSMSKVEKELLPRLAPIGSLLGAAGVGGLTHFINRPKQEEQGLGKQANDDNIIDFNEKKNQRGILPSQHVPQVPDGENNVVDLFQKRKWAKRTPNPTLDNEMLTVDNELLRVGRELNQLNESLTKEKQLQEETASRLDQLKSSYQQTDDTLGTVGGLTDSYDAYQRTLKNLRRQSMVDSLKAGALAGGIGVAGLGGLAYWANQRQNQE